MSLLISGDLRLAKDYIPVDPSFANVSLLLHGNGTNGSTTITDNSPSPKTVTAVGNAQISTAQSKFGGASIAFDGTGDYLTLPSGTAFQFGTGDFTVEMWVYFSNAASNQIYLLDARNASQTTAWAFFRNDNINPSFSNKLAWFTGSVVLTGPLLTTANTWTHLAVAKQGTSFRFFVNGVLSDTATDTTDYSVAPTLSYIASRFSASDQLNGYIDDLRITKGVARYTGNFTPPASPFPDIASR